MFLSHSIILGSKFLYNLSLYLSMLVIGFPCPSRTEIVTPQWTIQIEMSLRFFVPFVQVEQKLSIYTFI